jgi:hypothetical protein
MNYLDESKLRTKVPSIFAQSGAVTTSDRYSFIPTIETVRRLKNEGYYPVDAKENKARKEERKGFTRHMIRFRHESGRLINECMPEVVLVSSHDGSCSYKLMAGVYRFVCCNGLIVGNSLFCKKVKHCGDVQDKVVEGANEILGTLPLALEKCEQWRSILIAPDVRLEYLKKAKEIRWDEDHDILPRIVGNTRRDADCAPNLWCTFNAVQENLLKGRQIYFSSDDNGNLRRCRTTEIKSVSEIERINTQLWNLTEEYALSLV